MRNLVRSCSTADDLCLFGIYSEPEVVEAAFERGWPGRTLGIPPRCMYLRVTAHMWWGTITHCFDRVIEGLAYFGCEQTGLSGLSCLTPLDWATSTFSPLT